MITAKERLLELIEEIPPSDVEEVLYYVERIKERQGIDSAKQDASFGEIDISYFDSDIDDAVWKEL